MENTPISPEPIAQQYLAADRDSAIFIAGMIMEKWRNLISYMEDDPPSSRPQNILQTRQYTDAQLQQDIAFCLQRSGKDHVHLEGPPVDDLQDETKLTLTVHMPTGNIAAVQLEDVPRSLVKQGENPRHMNFIQRFLSKWRNPMRWNANEEFPDT